METVGEEEDSFCIHPTRVALDLHPPEDPGKGGTVAARLLIVWFQVEHFKVPGPIPSPIQLGAGGLRLGGVVSKPPRAGIILVPVFHVDKQVCRAGARLGYAAGQGFGLQG